MVVHDGGPGEVAGDLELGRFSEAPHADVHRRHHCVTKWTKLDTKWLGVTVDTLLKAVQIDPAGRYVTAYSDGGYTTNVPLDEMVNGQAFVAYQFDDKPLEPVHGGPARLVVLHLYFWKSAKWIRGFRFMDKNLPGFWESLGYHIHGDPWKEERYSGD